MKKIFPNINFKFIISSAIIGVRKSTQYIFDLALNIMDIKKEQINYIGDQLDIDIIGASKYGINAVFFKEDKAHLKIDNKFVEIDNVLSLRNYF